MITVIIASAGSSRRMGGGRNKVFLGLRGRPVLLYSLELFQRIPDVTEIIVVTGKDDVAAVKEMTAMLAGGTAVKVIAGGSERQYSVAKALEEVSPDAGFILVHDGARPLVRESCIQAVIDAARKYQAAIIAVPVKDTIKIANEEGFAGETPDRSKLWAIQTPQAFTAPLLLQAYDKAKDDGFLGTDDASLVERLGIPVKLVAGDYGNLKITTPEDVLMAEALTGKREDGRMRVGVGYDVHRLAAGRKLVLGGVEIAYEYGLDGHSDADVLLHAIKDALLGAAGLGDIGRHFPDSDGQYKGISSLLLLAKVREILKEHGFGVCNIDATIVAEKPKLAPFIPAMNVNIAQTLEIDAGRVNIKATTTEGLGFTGQKEGMAAYAVVSLYQL